VDRPEFAANALTSSFAWLLEISCLDLENDPTGLGGNDTWARGVAARTLEGVNSAEVAIIFEGGFEIDSSRTVGVGCPCVTSNPGGTDGVDDRETQPKPSTLRGPKSSG